MIPHNFHYCRTSLLDYNSYENCASLLYYTQLSDGCRSWSINYWCSWPWDFERTPEIEEAYPRERDNEDAKKGAAIRNDIANTMWQDYVQKNIINQ